MQENLDEELARKFEFWASCLFVSFLPFIFAPWPSRPDFDPHSWEIVWALV